ncbi:MAG: hypothetical protein U5L07_07830 [Desulfobacterales bacterium]|nr:hypothetical protein [Desulfobacterales bacterium]
MKKLFVCLFVVCFLFAAGRAGAIEVEKSFFRSGNKLVSEGDSVSELVRNFGRPHYKEAKFKYIERGGNWTKVRINYWYYSVPDAWGDDPDDLRITVYGGKVQRIVEID